MANLFVKPRRSSMPVIQLDEDLAMSLFAVLSLIVLQGAEVPKSRHIAIGSVDTRSFGQPIDPYRLQWSGLATQPVSDEEFLALENRNYVVARCSLTGVGVVQDCKVINASLRNDRASKAYVRLLETVRAVNCGDVDCSGLKVVLYMRLFIPGAKEPERPSCIAPFCNAEPLPPPPPPPPELADPAPLPPT